MEVNQVVQIIQSVGFPIVMCGAMGWFVWYTTKNHREDVLKLNEQHQQEMSQTIEAINNNTLVIERLCTLMDTERKAD